MRVQGSVFITKTAAETESFVWAKITCHFNKLNNRPQQKQLRKNTEEFHLLRALLSDTEAEQVFKLTTNRYLLNLV